jgi:predicted aldo/keto reductase-like oxidoreductase
MQTDYADCLMIHSVPDEKVLVHAGYHAAVKELKAEGKLKHAGISNHGSVDPDLTEVMGKVIMAAAEDGRFDVVLMTYNHLQEDLSLDALKACHDKKIGVTLMKTNPVGGYLGMKAAMEKMKEEKKELPDYLTESMPIMTKKYEDAQAFLKKYNLEDPQDIRNAAIKFCLNNPKVNSVCIGFRNFDDVEKYVGLSGKRLTAADAAALAVYAQAFGQFYCRHACGICESSCSKKVPVNTVMRYNHYFAAQGREKYAMEQYAKLNAGVANNCLNCDGSCEKSCPYKVPIQKLLVLADRNLTLA